MTESLALPTYPTLLLRYDGPVATVTLNRPEVLNALNAAMFDDLEQVLSLLTKDPSIRAVVLTGAGEKAFAAGADIAGLTTIDPAEGARISRRGQGVMGMLETCEKPVLAAINGFALGGGLELALCCTLRLAAETAKLGMPEVALGLIPGYGGTQRLPRLVGRAAALKLLLTGERVSSAEALRLGLVDEVLPPAQLLPRALELAQTLAAAAPLAVQAALRAVREGAGKPLEDALQLESEIFGSLFPTHDKAEGVDAFLNKRKPLWTGQ